MYTHRDNSNKCDKMIKLRTSKVSYWHIIFDRKIMQLKQNAWEHNFDNDDIN